MHPVPLEILILEKEKQRQKEQQSQRQQIQLPLPIPPPDYMNDVENNQGDEGERGVVIIDIGGDVTEDFIVE